LREEVAKVVGNKHFMVSVMTSEYKAGEMKFQFSSGFTGEEIKVEGVGEEGARPGEGEEAEVSGGGTPGQATLKNFNFFSLKNNFLIFLKKKLKN
jgi:hypothetical protein